MTIYEPIIEVNMQEPEKELYTHGLHCIPLLASFLALRVLPFGRSEVVPIEEDYLRNIDMD